jgi:hypothetical protein
MPSAWNMFVKKIYQEGKAKDSSYEFKQALVDASKRKSEMGSTSSTKSHNKSHKKTRGKRSRRNKNASVSMSMTGGKRKSRRHRRH